jgi:hypothetical protein
VAIAWTTGTLGCGSRRDGVSSKAGSFDSSLQVATGTRPVLPGVAGAPVTSPPERRRGSSGSIATSGMTSRRKPERPPGPPLNSPRISSRRDRLRRDGHFRRVVPIKVARRLANRIWASVPPLLLVPSSWK